MKRLAAFVAIALFTALNPAYAAKLRDYPECVELVGTNPDRIYAHLRYRVWTEDSVKLELIEQPDWSDVRPEAVTTFKACYLRSEVRRDLDRLIAAARAAHIELNFRSCARDIDQQVEAFCQRAREHRVSLVERALQSAPPGYSEHHTGYALDFADPNYSYDWCHLEACAEGTPGSRWLQRNAQRFNFERSFPANNGQCFEVRPHQMQCITAEPWHWRWVGSDHAREIFAYAREHFPANPSVPDPEPAH